MRFGGTAGAWTSSNGTASATKPRGTSPTMGATTTMCAQQQRQPSPEPPSSESPVEWLEKMQLSGEISWQAKISVAAISSTRTVTTRRTVDPCAIVLVSIVPQDTVASSRSRLVFYLHSDTSTRLINRVSIR